MRLSIIIPLFNEAENVRPLLKNLIPTLDELGEPYEVILVNDGSVDETEALLLEHAKIDKRIKVLNLKRNFGQTAAMMAGIDYARGDIIIPMDGDLQNDPVDISLLLKKLEEGFDVVSGWRINRKDSEFRNFPSRIANRVISKISGVTLHDYGCTLKAYRKDVIQNVRLYGEMHRFIPIYASWQGGRIAEIPVNHNPRIHGKSKYGMGRIIKVVLDMIVVKFLADYATKPIYVFGAFGLFSLFLSVPIAGYMCYLKFFENTSFISTPLPLLVALTFLTGIMSILIGLVAELTMRTYHESQDKPVYLIKTKVNITDDY